MELEQIKELYAPKECATQIEFEQLMRGINDEQEKFNRPYIDQDGELLERLTLLNQQKKAIDIQMLAIRQERANILSTRKAFNRECHDLKHKLCVLNPPYKFVKEPKL